MKEHLEIPEPIKDSVEMPKKSNQEILKRGQELEANYINLYKQRNDLTDRYNKMLDDQVNPQHPVIRDHARAHEALELLTVINEIKYKEKIALETLEKYKSTLSPENKKYIDDKTAVDMEQFKHAA